LNSLVSRDEIIEKKGAGCVVEWVQ